MLRTVKYPDPSLKASCTPYDFGIPAVQQEFNLPEFLDAMAQHMRSENGIGLAANQVGNGSRIFIMLDQKGKLWEFVNPEIVDRDGTQQINEGCLSAPGVFVQVPRAETVTVKARDRSGEEFSVVCSGIEAVCIQHELDHLDGVFFLEKTSRNQRRAALRALGIK